MKTRKKPRKGGEKRRRVRSYNDAEKADSDGVQLVRYLDRGFHNAQAKAERKERESRKVKTKRSHRVPRAKPSGLVLGSQGMAKLGTLHDFYVGGLEPQKPSAK